MIATQEQTIIKPDSVYEGHTHRIYLNHQQKRVKFFYTSPPKKKIKLIREKTFSQKYPYINLTEKLSQQQQKDKQKYKDNRQSVSSNRSDGSHRVNDKLMDVQILEFQFSGRKKCYNPKETSQKFYFSKIEQVNKGNNVFKQYELLQNFQPNSILPDKKKIVKLKLLKNYNTHSKNNQNHTTKLFAISQNRSSDKKKRQMEPQNIEISMNFKQKQREKQKQNMLTQPKTKHRHKISHAVIHLYENSMHKKQKYHQKSRQSTINKNRGYYSMTNDKNYNQSQQRVVNPFRTQYQTPIKEFDSNQKSKSRSKSKKGISVMSSGSAKLYIHDDRRISEKPFQTRVHNPIQRLKSKSRFLRQSPNSEQSIPLSSKKKRVVSSEKLPRKKRLMQ